MFPSIGALNLSLTMIGREECRALQRKIRTTAEVLYRLDHYHQWHHSPNMSLGLFWDVFRSFSTNFFLQGEVVSLTLKPQPGGPGLRIYTPETGLLAIPWTLGSSGTSGSPFPVPSYMGPWRDRLDQTQKLLFSEGVRKGVTLPGM
jgi:hypothetical protein